MRGSLNFEPAKTVLSVFYSARTFDKKFETNHQSGRITSATGEKPIQTNIESWPWLVHMDSIDEYDDYGTSNLGCMGSILTKNWILTSAKCCTYMGCDSRPAGCDPNKNRIVTGKQKVGFEDLFFSQETDHEPSQAFIHPQDSFQRSYIY